MAHAHNRLCFTDDQRYMAVLTRKPSLLFDFWWVMWVPENDAKALGSVLCWCEPMLDRVGTFQADLQQFSQQHRG